MAQPKPNEILTIERAYNIALTQGTTKEFDKYVPGRKAFCLDETGAVTHLDINHFQISDLSPIAAFTRLTDLRLYDNQISDLSPLASLTGLTVLWLQNNQISDLSPLASLTRLTKLFLSENQITDISPLASLTGLTDLFLDRNQIADLSPLATLTELIELILRGNQISNLSPLAALTGLAILWLDENQIADLSPLALLTGLEILSLSSNHISDLSPLAALTGLTSLDLSYNQIADLSPLATLTRLTLLYLESNQIADLSPLAPLTGLTQLVLRKNQIVDLSPLAPLFAKNLEYIEVDNNPIETPPIEIVDKGSGAIISYFKQLEKSKVRLLQCKLLIVGSGEVGKTTLMKKLKDPLFQINKEEPTTHGINITPWELPCTFGGGCTPGDKLAHLPPTSTPSEMSDCTVKLFFWDFGGQDIYHSTHQFFLTKRSLYILVWEARKKEEKENSFDYWLNIVKLLGSGSPVIIVMNKSDLRISPVNEESM